MLGPHAGLNAKLHADICFVWGSEPRAKPFLFAVSVCLPMHPKAIRALLSPERGRECGPFKKGPYCLPGGKGFLLDEHVSGAQHLGNAIPGVERRPRLPIAGVLISLITLENSLTLSQKTHMLYSTDVSV